MMWLIFQSWKRGSLYVRSKWTNRRKFIYVFNKICFHLLHICMTRKVCKNRPKLSKIIHNSVHMYTYLHVFLFKNDEGLTQNDYFFAFFWPNCEISPNQVTLLTMSIRVARWVCEKSRPNCNPTYFFSTWKHSWSAGKKVVPKFNCFCIFQKNNQSKQSTNRRNFAQSGHPDGSLPMPERRFIFFGGMETGRPDGFVKKSPKNVSQPNFMSRLLFNFYR
jgi:hypothetical protein